MDSSHKKVAWESVKPALLLAFVLTCLILTILIWRESLAGGEGNTPGYVRFTPGVEGQTLGGTPVPPGDQSSVKTWEGQSPLSANPDDLPGPSGTPAWPTDPEPTMSLMDQ